MSYQDILKANLTVAEGRIPHVYQDSLGYWTIGIGHLVDKRKGGRISDAAIDFIFNDDMALVEYEAAQVVPSFDTLSDNRKAAIAEMVFNLGEGGLALFTTFLGLIAIGEFNGAADDLVTTKWAKQVGARATRISQQIREG